MKRFVVRWRHVDSKRWKDFYPDPAEFNDLQRAQTFIDEQYEDSPGSYFFRVFEVQRTL